MSEWSKEWIGSRYYKLLGIPSDINEHMPMLRFLASSSETVVEFGVRHGVSTTALLMGAPGMMWSYDINDCACAVKMAKIVPGFRFQVANSCDVLPRSCDLLFLDTYHSFAQLKAELNRHAPLCRKFIVMHDTELFGDVGEDGNQGINRAWEEWRDVNPGWMVSYRVPFNNGLTVLQKVTI